MPKNYIDLVRLRFEHKMVRSGYQRPIWQQEIKQEVLHDEEVVNKAKFIIDNPLRNGLVSDPTKYRYSFVLGGKQYAP